MMMMIIHVKVYATDQLQNSEDAISLIDPCVNGTSVQTSNVLTFTALRTHHDNISLIQYAPPTILYNNCCSCI